MNGIPVARCPMKVDLCKRLRDGSQRVRAARELHALDLETVGVRGTFKQNQKKSTRSVGRESGIPVLRSGAEGEEKRS